MKGCPKALSSVLTPEKENTKWKPLFVWAKVKKIKRHYIFITLQHYNWVACFENKLNFMKWRSNYVKFFDKKLAL